MRQNETDEQYMRRCLQLARRGRLGAAPNPMVGAVAVCEGRIIGEGFHQRCGEAHAEVNAIRSVREEDRPLLRRSTLYVSLEPCAHYGKTPPCAQLIIDTGIPHVVVGCRDPFARVDGRGITMLREAGVEVREGVLEEECRQLNRRFITFHTQHRPYITLKWAQSEDGFIDRRRESPEEPPVHFSTPTTQALVHQLRAGHEAILVGRRTWELDRPSLTVRHWHGRSPLPVVLSSSPVGNETNGTTTPPHTPPLVYGDPKAAAAGLWEKGVQSLLVEGGAQTLQSFINAGLWDEIRVETAPLHLETGIQAPHPPAAVSETFRIDGNRIDVYRKTSE